MVKAVESTAVGSSTGDGVFLCSSETDTIAAFRSIYNQVNGLGHLNEGALCQVNDMGMLTLTDEPIC